MALVKCPECGRENVSDTAESCPGCGFNLKQYFLEREKIQQEQENKRLAEQERIRKLEDDKQAFEQKKSKLIKFMPIVIIGVVAIVVGILISQNIKEKKRLEYEAEQEAIRKEEAAKKAEEEAALIAENAIKAYESGAYTEALKNLDSLDDKDRIDSNMQDKIKLAGNFYSMIGEADNALLYDHIDNAIDIYKELILYSISNYERLKEYESDLDDFINKTLYKYELLNKEGSAEDIESAIADEQEKALFSSIKGQRKNSLKIAAKDEIRKIKGRGPEFDKEREEAERERLYEEYQKTQPLIVTDIKLTGNGKIHYVKGTLRNQSDSSFSFVRVQVKYYDKSDKMLTSDWTYVVDSVPIEPGENIQFTIMTSVEGVVESCSTSIVDYITN